MGRVSLKLWGFRVRSSKGPEQTKGESTGFRLRWFDLVRLIAHEEATGNEALDYNRMITMRAANSDLLPMARSLFYNLKDLHAG